MDKYRKKTLIEVVAVKDGNYLVQNENGSILDRWIIPKEVFEETYEKVEQ